MLPDEGLPESPHLGGEGSDDQSDLAERLPPLRGEIAKLGRLLLDLEADERDAQQQIQSLTYAADLTRGESARRARANAEMSSAYQRRSAPRPSSQALSALERELLNAKRDAANVTFELEQLEFRLKKMREQAAARRPGIKGVPDVRSPSSPALRESPQLTSLASGNLAARKMSPLARPSRLIGDVDCLVGFVDDRKNALASSEYAPCRLGVSASVHMALYAYSSPMPQLELDDASAKLGTLEEYDVEGLRRNMDSVGLQIGGENYWLCGLRESVGSSMQLVQDASKLLRTDDEEIVSTG